MDFIPLLQSIEMSKVAFNQDEQVRNSKEKGNLDGIRSSSLENDHYFRKALCHSKLQEIFHLQKLKRVNHLKDEMIKVNNLGHSSHPSSDPRSTTSTRPTSVGHTSPPDTETPQTSADYHLTSINSYLNRHERIPFSPNAGLASSPRSGMTVEDTSVMTKLDMDPQELEEELKEENLVDYKELVDHFDDVNSLLIDSSDEADLGKKERSRGQKKSPSHQARVIGRGRKDRSLSKASHSIEREEKEDLALNSDEEEEMSEEYEDEEDERDDRSYRSPSSPKIRYPKRYKLPGRQNQKQPFRPSSEDSYFSDAEDERPDEKSSNDPSHLLPLPPPSPSSSLLLTSPHYYHHSNPITLPLITEEIIWDLRLPKHLMIADSKLFFFHNILWRLTFGLNNLVENYYYFFISPAERLKTFISLKVDFLLYGSNALQSSSSSTSPIWTPMIKPSSSVLLATMNIKRDDEKGNEKVKGEVGDELKVNSARRLTAEDDMNNQGNNHANNAKRKPLYAKRSSQNFTFPVEFSVGRGYDRFISKEDLQMILTKESQQQMTNHQQQAQSPSTMSPTSSSTVSLNYHHLKLAVVISTNLGPNGELIGCLNL